MPCPHPPTPDPVANSSPESVWTGTEMMVWGGGHHASLNPCTNKWRTISETGFITGAAGGHVMVWTGKQVVVFGGMCCDEADDAGEVFDPATRRWYELSKGPLGARMTSAAWTGTEVVFTAGRTDTAHGGVLRDAVAYNPGTRRWRSLPLMPFSGNYQSFWDGRRILAVGESGAAASSPGSTGWNVLLPPRRGWQGVTPALADDRLLVLSGSDGEVFSDGSWTKLPKTRVLKYGAVIVWTGRQVLVYGGDRRTDGVALTL